MNVITAPGPVTYQELLEAARRKSTRSVEEIVQGHISRCFNDPEARDDEDLTVLVKNYLISQKPTFLKHDEAWAYWGNYFMNAIFFDFPLENKRQGAWAFIALSTKHHILGVASFTANCRLQKCLEILRIPFDFDADIVTDSSELNIVLGPKILCQIATTFDLPTDFNERYRIWQKSSYERDHIQLISATQLMIPPLSIFTAKCSEKKEQEGPGHPNPHYKDL